MNSKKKGSKNERNVSKLFTQWTGYEFARTPQSGGLHWQKNNTIGDIVCIDDKHSRRFPFSIECKSYAEIDFSYMIDSTTGKKSNKIFIFWDQAKGDAIKVNKVPLLFMRRNMMKANTHFVVMPTEYFNLLILNLENLSVPLGMFQYTNDNGYHLTILNSEDFFKFNYKACYKVALKFNRGIKNGEDRT